MSGGEGGEYTVIYRAIADFSDLTKKAAIAKAEMEALTGNTEKFNKASAAGNAERLAASRSEKDLSAAVEGHGKAVESDTAAVVRNSEAVDRNGKFWELMRGAVTRSTDGVRANTSAVARDTEAVAANTNAVDRNVQAVGKAVAEHAKFLQTQRNDAGIANRANESQARITNLKDTSAALRDVRAEQERLTAETKRGESVKTGDTRRKALEDTAAALRDVRVETEKALADALRPAKVAGENARTASTFAKLREDLAKADAAETTASVAGVIAIARKTAALQASALAAANAAKATQLLTNAEKAGQAIDLRRDQAAETFATQLAHRDAAAKRAADSFTTAQTQRAAAETRREAADTRAAQTHELRLTRLRQQIAATNTAAGTLALTLARVYSALDKGARSVARPLDDAAVSRPITEFIERSRNAATAARRVDSLFSPGSGSPFAGSLGSVESRIGGLFTPGSGSGIKTGADALGINRALSSPGDPFRVLRQKYQDFLLYLKTTPVTDVTSAITDRLFGNISAVGKFVDSPKLVTDRSTSRAAGTRTTSASEGLTEPLTRAISSLRQRFSGDEGAIRLPAGDGFSAFARSAAAELGKTEGLFGKLSAAWKRTTEDIGKAGGSGGVFRNVFKGAGDAESVGTRAMEKVVAGVHSVGSAAEDLASRVARAFSSVRKDFEETGKQFGGGGGIRNFFTSVATAAAGWGSQLSQAFTGVAAKFLGFRGLIFLAVAAAGPLTAALGALGASALGLGANLVSLSGVLAAVPTFFAAAAASVGALYLAFSPMAKVLSAYGAVQTATISSGSRLVTSQGREKTSQLELNDARRQATRDLQDLKDAVDRIGLNEDEARLRVAQARQQYLETLGDPNATYLDRAAAANSYKEAQFDLRDVLVKNQRTQQDYDIALVKGTGTTAAMTTAQQNLNNALAVLGPNAQIVAKALIAQGTAWTDLKKRIGDDFFGPIVTQTSKLPILLNTVATLLEPAATALGNIAAKAIALLTSGPWQADLQRLGTDIGNIVTGVGTAVLDILDALRNISAAASTSGFITYLVNGFKSIAQSFDEWSSAARTSTLPAFLAETEHTLSDVYRIVANISSALFAVLGASADFGKSQLDSMVQVTAKWAEFAQHQTEAGSGLRTFLTQIKPLLHDVTDFVGKFARALGTLAADPRNIQEAERIFKSLATNVLPALVDIFTQLAHTGAIGDLVDGIGKFAHAVAGFIASGGALPLTTFLSTFLTTLTGLVTLFSNPVTSHFFNIVRAGIAAIAAISLVASITGLTKMVTLLARIAGFIRVIAAGEGVLKGLQVLTGRSTSTDILSNRTDTAKQDSATADLNAAAGKLTTAATQLSEAATQLTEAATQMVAASESEQTAVTEQVVANNAQNTADAENNVLQSEAANAENQAAAQLSEAATQLGAAAVTEQEAAVATEEAALASEESGVGKSGGSSGLGGAAGVGLGIGALVTTGVLEGLALYYSAKDRDAIDQTVTPAMAQGVADYQRQQRISKSYGGADAGSYFSSLDKLGPSYKSISVLLQSLSDNTSTAEQNSKAFADSLDAIHTSSLPATEALSQYRVVADQVNASNLTAAQKGDTYRQILDDISASAGTTKDKLAPLTAVYNDIAAAQLDAATKADLLEQAFQAQQGTQIKTQATTESTQRSFNALTDATDKHKYSLKDTSDAALDSRDKIASAADASRLQYFQEYAAAGTDKKKQDEATAAYKARTSTLYDLAAQFTATKKEAKKLVDEETAKVPDPKNTSTTTLKVNDTQALSSLQTIYDALFQNYIVERATDEHLTIAQAQQKYGKQSTTAQPVQTDGAQTGRTRDEYTVTLPVDPNTKTSTTTTKKKNVPVGRASGGLVGGAADGRTDNLQYLLSAGEWITRNRVVNKPYAKMLLSDLNEERLDPASVYAGLNSQTRGAITPTRTIASVPVSAGSSSSVTNAGVHTGDITIHNPVRERSERSLRRQLQKLAYLGDR